jgi:hypothetical protein
MKYGLEAADAWLSSLSSVWKRAGLFWCFVAGTGWASMWLLGGANAGEAFAAVLQLGGGTCVLLGPVFVWSVLVAAVTWVRFVHLETAGSRSVLLLGVLVSINGWLGDERLFAWHFILLQVAALGMIGLAMGWSDERRWGLWGSKTP